MSPTRRPVNRCAVKGCPVVGHWPEGGLCPMHDDPFDAPFDIPIHLPPTDH